jgi:hypothetical protein
MHPLLAEIRDTGILSNVDTLSQLAVDTGADIRSLQSSILDEANVNSLRQSIATLTKTLQHIESITDNMGQVSSDDGVRSSLRTLIESFSRLVDD